MMDHMKQWTQVRVHLNLRKNHQEHFDIGANYLERPWLISTVSIKTEFKNHLRCFDLDSHSTQEMNSVAKWF